MQKSKKPIKISLGDGDSDHSPATNYRLLIPVNDSRSVMKGLKADVVEEWYDGIRLWDKCLMSPDLGGAIAAWYGGWCVDFFSFIFFFLSFTHHTRPST